MQMETKKKPPDPEFVLRTIGGGITCITDGGQWRDCDVIFVGSADGSISIWDKESKRPIKYFGGCSKKSVLTVKWLGSNRFFSHDRDGNIVLWNLSELDPVIEDKLTVYQFGFCPATVFQNGTDILVGFQANSDSQLNVMNLKTKNVLFQLKPADKLGMIMHAKLFLSNDAKQLSALVGYEDGSVILWDVASCLVKSHIKTHKDAVMCMDIDSECSKAVVGSADATLVQISMPIASGESMKIARTVELKSQGIASLRIRPDRKIVAAGCWDGKVRVFGWKKLTPLAVLQYHSETVNCIEYSISNKILCGSKDGKISIWNVYNES